MTLKKFAIAITLLLTFALASFGAAQAITALYKQVTGIGNVDYSDEVTVTNIRVTGPSKVQVTMVSNVTTVPDYVYTVTLYLDSVAVVPTTTVTWPLVQIPGVPKNVSFTGLTLGPVASIGVEVTK